MADDLTTAILSPDFATADRALTEAIKRRDTALVARALDQQHLEIKLKAAEALAETGDRASVSRLIAALEGNQVVYTGGGETMALQRDLNRALVTAIGRLTGVDFGAVDPESPQDIDKALRLARAWWEKNKN